MNNLVLGGRIGSDLELRETNGGKSVLNFSLAVKRNNKNDDGSYKTDWFRLTAWEGQAKLIANYLQKGSFVNIVGRLETGEYTKDVNGTEVKIPKTEVIVKEVSFTGAADAASGGGNDGGGQSQSDDELPAF